MIQGGYILQPRKVDESLIMHDSPVTRELWFYLIRKVNYKDNGKFKRGTGFFNLSDIANDLHWYVGFRKMMYKKPALTKSLRRLCERNMIETVKETRGVFVSICNYDIYQNPDRYEGNNEVMMKEQRRANGVITISKEREERKNIITSSKEEESVTSVTNPPDLIDYEGFKKYWNDKKLPSVREITVARKRAINARVKQYDKHTLRQVIDKVADSAFLSGENDRKWKANLDWILKPSNFTKILEGYYNNTNTKRLTVEELFA